MNRFIQKKSVFFLAVGWVFVLTLFADGANLDDLIPGTVVVHSDEEYSLQTDAQMLTPMASALPVRSHSLPQHSATHESPKPASPLKIVYDQDSDSIAANPILASESFVVFPPTKEPCVQTPSYSQSLYLLHCTLLI